MQEQVFDYCEQQDKKKKILLTHFDKLKLPSLNQKLVKLVACLFLSSYSSTLRIHKTFLYISDVTFISISQREAETYLLCNHTRSIDRRSASNCEGMRRKKVTLQDRNQCTYSAFSACHNFLMLHNDGHTPAIVITPVCGKITQK